MPYFAEIKDGKVFAIFQADTALQPDWVESNEHVRPGYVWSPTLLTDLSAAAFKAAKVAAQRSSKLAGIEFDGVMCSATKDDQDGLLAVWVDYMGSPNNFLPTRFEFSNGNTLVLTKDNLPSFRAVWGTFRRQFFNA